MREFLRSWPTATGAVGGSVLALLLAGCMGSDKVREDLFNVQTRLLQLERKVDEGGEKSKTQGDHASKKLASTSVALEEMNGEIQRIKGDIEMLKVAVTKGRLPGADADEDTIGKSLENMVTRVAALEESEVKILNLLDKGAEKKNRSNFDTVASVQAAFAKGRFKNIAEDVPGVLRKFKGGEQSDVKFILAESLFKLGKLREAVLTYDELIKSKAPHGKVPLMYLRVGDCFRHLGDKQTSLVYYKELIGSYPKSSEATKAQDHVKKIQ